MSKETTQNELASIRKLMERSVTFVSLSGMSGILAGLYALIGAGFAYQQIYSGGVVRSLEYYGGRIPIFQNLILIAALVLVASLLTGWWFSLRKAKKLGTSIWNTTSRRLLINLAIPLLVGGFFTLVLLYHAYFDMVGASVLIFYGLALLNASSNLFEEVRYLGFCELILGLLAAVFPAHALHFWTIGFGLMHILYGSLMYKKYDR